MTKTIISAALTGVLATREQCPAIPYTPMEIAEEAKRAAEAGAAIVHIHARKPEGGPDWRVETFAEIFSEVRARTDAIIQFFLETMNAAGVRPEMECFDAGHIGNTRPLIDMGVLQPPLQFSLIMGVLGGIPGTTRHLVDQVDGLPAGSHWQVIGIGL